MVIDACETHLLLAYHVNASHLTAKSDVRFEVSLRGVAWSCTPQQLLRTEKGLAEGSSSAERENNI